MFGFVQSKFLDHCSRQHAGGNIMADESTLNHPDLRSKWSDIIIEFLPIPTGL